MSEQLPAVIDQKPEELETAVADAPVWERLKGESRTAYSNFTSYRDQTRGRHSLARAATDLGKHIATIKEQSAKYHWQDRVDAYEDYLERRDRQIREQARDDINRQGVTIGRAGMALIAARLGGGKFRDQDVQAINPHDVEAADLARMGDVFWKMARLGSGQPTDAVKGLVQVTTEDHLKIVEALYQITQHVLPEELQQRFATLWNNYLDTGRLPWS